MIARCLLLTILQVTTSLPQYMVDTAMRADMTFDDENNRFDVGNIIKEQNREFRDQPTPMEEDEYRRRFNDGVPLVEVIKYNRRRLRQKALDEKPQRRMDDFAYHDKMLSEPDDNDGSYDKNLAEFTAQNSRRKLQVIDISQMNSTSDFKNQITSYRRDDGQISVEDVNNKEAKSLQEVVLKYLHEGKDVKGKNGRRMAGYDPKNEVLLHYAVPIQLKVNGYLEMPKDI